MSHAPVLAEDYQGDDRRFAEATDELNRQVAAGTSWSGNERNNVFLNLGRRIGDTQAPDFAEISALAGFDLPDDSRGLVSIDWDFDGDLDFVTTNRTAPRVRIFENRMVDRQASWVSIKLVGTSENRDAIGSRVELVLSGAGEELIHLNRSLHGGQGFISQSSKWLHFGIPDGAGIVSVLVSWGGQPPEKISAIDAGKFWIITQGSTSANQWGPPKSVIPHAGESHLPVEDPEPSTVIAHLERPIPLPAIPYTNLAGVELSIKSGRERPLLLNLWATWCAPCVAELEAFAAEAQNLRGAGIDVLALCVDAQAGDEAATAHVRQIIADTGFPFEVGLASETTLELLHFAHNSAFVRPSQLPVPTTLLIAPGSRIASVARGAVSPADLAPALAALAQPAEQWQRFSRPGDGRWIHGPDTVYYVGIAKEMIQRGWIDEAAKFLIAQRDALKTEGKKYAEMLMLTGTKLLEMDESADGIELLQAAVDAAPDLAIARNNLAVALLGGGQDERAIPHLEAAIAAAPEFAEPKVNLARLHSTERRYGQALSLVEEVLKSGYHGGAIRVKAQVLVAQGKTFDLYNVFQEIVDQEPEQPSAWLNLAKLQMGLGDKRSALASFEKAAELVPGNQEIRATAESLRQQLAPPGDGTVED